MAGAITRGVLFVHSSPRALCPHVEWAAGSVLGARLSLDWTEQPAAPGMYRAEHSWLGEAGTARVRCRALTVAGLRLKVFMARQLAKAACGADSPIWHTVRYWERRKSRRTAMCWCRSAVMPRRC